MKDSDQYHVARDIENLGTYSEIEIADFFYSGHFLADDLVWQTGMSDWQPLIQVFPRLLPCPPQLPVSLPPPQSQFPPPVLPAPGYLPHAGAPMPAAQPRFTQVQEAKLGIFRRFFKGSFQLVGYAVIIGISVFVKAMLKPDPAKDPKVQHQNVMRSSEGLRRQVAEITQRNLNNYPVQGTLNNERPQPTGPVKPPAPQPDQFLQPAAVPQQ